MKIADDLYCGADSPDALLTHWHAVLESMHRCGMCLTAPKTFIAPRTTTILGWKWQMSTLSGTPHRLSTLSTCSPPENVKGMRSFIGAYKVLSRVIESAAVYTSPLDASTAGKQSSDKVDWTEELKIAFLAAQKALSTSKTIHLPRSEDALWIVCDGSVSRHGIGATQSYVTRDTKPRLAGYFSAKLQARQVTWLPCEIEVLAIASATKHYAPYIIQSRHSATILTDSKPCVQAYEKLCRGEFSASPRVSTFLSVVSRYQATVRHIAGVANLPSDHASCHAIQCDDSQCQLCQFVRRTEDSVVRKVTPSHILSGSTKLPFTNRSTRLGIQADDPDLQRTCAHLKQGTRPSKKLTNVKDVKRYIQVASIASDGLLVVKSQEPLCRYSECIIVPRQVLHGILSALHIKLEPQTKHQLEMVVKRMLLYALDMDRAIASVSQACHSCASIRNTPAACIEQSTCEPPKALGTAFAADVLRRERQLILVVRECVSSYTLTSLLENER